MIRTFKGAVVLLSGENIIVKSLEYLCTRTSRLDTIAIVKNKHGGGRIDE